MCKALSITAAALLTGFSFTALNAAHAATITLGTDVDAGTLDPRLARDTTAYRVADLIYSGLVHLTPGLDAEARPRRKLGKSEPDHLDLQASAQPEILRWQPADVSRRGIYLHHYPE